MTAQEFQDRYVVLSAQLYRAALYMLQSEADAEDAVQDLYAKLWKSRESLGDIGNPLSYCLSMIRNLCIDRIRRANVRKSRPLDDSVDPPDPEASVDVRSEERERLRRVQTAIGSLPERQRLVFRMKVLQEMSYEEITQKTGIDNLSLRVLLSQARKRIKNLI